MRRLLEALSAPLPLDDPRYSSLDESFIRLSSVAWLRPRVFQRMAFRISLPLCFLSFLCLDAHQLIPVMGYVGLGCAVLETFVFGMYLWLMQDTFSFRRLRDVLSVEEAASKFAKRHLVLIIPLAFCFIFVWSCALGFLG